MPVLLILIGFSFSKVSFYKDSPNRILTPFELPLKQRMIVNENLVKKATNSINDISPHTLMGYLPGAEAAFDITYKDYSGVQTNGK